MINHEHHQSDRIADLDTLRRVAALSNCLAKKLSGASRTLAYRIKAEACSSLILHGAASVNGVSAAGIIALDIPGNRLLRLHIRRSHLTAPARAALIRQASTAPVVSNLAERCGINAFVIPGRGRSARKEDR